MAPRRLVLLGLLPWACLASSASFEKTVQPFLKSNCLLCHNAKLKVGGLSLDGYANARAALQNREIWEKVIQKLRTGQMPPKGQPAPAPEQVASVTHWFELEFARMDRSLKPDPGRVTARRLNRVEYNNTVRDLTGVDFKPAADFPPDDSGYGFDNIGDVLSLSPVLMEKYLRQPKRSPVKPLSPTLLPSPRGRRLSIRQWLRKNPRRGI
jgi:cytochrome c551/c552